jgi:hypothetical protein
MAALLSQALEQCNGAESEERKSLLARLLSGAATAERASVPADCPLAPAQVLQLRAQIAGLRQLNLHRALAGQHLEAVQGDPQVRPCARLHRL